GVLARVADDTWSTTEVQESGVLRTGMHRYGTLEMKKYQRVRVQISGSEGTVTVSKVLPTGTAISLYTLDASVTHAQDIGLQMDDPAEMVGLHFELKRGPTGKSPILHGYQLFALPAPKRQRL